MIETESRTTKTARNIFFSIGYKLIDVIFAFILRTVFIQILGVSYLGISGLFTSILNVLSLLELGVGSAIAFSLYRPLAENDTEKISSLMQLYKHTYTLIGIFVCLIGFCLTPFLDKIINLPGNINHLTIIYCLSVLNTAISYFLAYRRTLLIADQRSDICIKVDMLFRFIRVIGLTAILLITKNYIFYLSFDVLNTFASNVVISLKVKKRYPYINDNNVKPLEKEEKINIIKYISSTLFNKFGQTIVNSTDSIIISMFISTSLVGYYSNYNMLYSNLDALIYLIFSNITASVGNYAVTKSNDESHSLFKKINLSNYFIVSVISVCFFCLASPFISIWIGKQYVLSDITIAIITLNFFIVANQNCIANFMSAIGELYYRNRFRSLVEGIVNLLASILLVKYTNLGITGIFLGTTICFLCGRVWMDARILYKYWFKIPFSYYIYHYILKLLIVIVMCLSMKFFTSIVFCFFGIDLLSWILCALCCTLFSCFVLVVVWWRTEEFKFLVSLVKRTFKVVKSKV